MRTLSSNWKAEALLINFNQKQWRQDIAYFIGKCKNWYNPRVTYAKTLKDHNAKKVKEFNIFNEQGEKFFVQFSNKNNIIDCSDDILVKEYLKGRV